MSDLTTLVNQLRREVFGADSPGLVERVRNLEQAEAEEDASPPPPPTPPGIGITETGERSLSQPTPEPYVEDEPTRCHGMPGQPGYPDGDPINSPWDCDGCEDCQPTPEPEPEENESRVRPTCSSCGYQDEATFTVRQLDTCDFQCPECGSTWFQFPREPTPEPEAELPFMWTDLDRSDGYLGDDGMISVMPPGANIGSVVQTTPEVRTRIRRALEVIDGIDPSATQRHADRRVEVWQWRYEKAREKAEKFESEQRNAVDKWASTDDKRLAAVQRAEEAEARVRQLEGRVEAVERCRDNEVRLRKDWQRAQDKSEKRAKAAEARVWQLEAERGKVEADVEKAAEAIYRFDHATPAWSELPAVKKLVYRANASIALEAALGGDRNGE